MDSSSTVDPNGTKRAIFTEFEKAPLAFGELVIRHKDITENKKTDAV